MNADGGHSCLENHSLQYLNLINANIGSYPPSRNERIIPKKSSRFVFWGFMMLCWFLGPLLDLPLVNAIKTTIICSSVIQLNIKVQYWKAMILISNSTALRAFKDRDPSSVFRIYSTPKHVRVNSNSNGFGLHSPILIQIETLHRRMKIWISSIQGEPIWSINLCNANTISHRNTAIVNKKITNVYTLKWTVLFPSSGAASTPPPLY